MGIVSKWIIPNIVALLGIAAAYAENLSKNYFVVLHQFVCIMRHIRISTVMTLNNWEQFIAAITDPNNCCYIPKEALLCQ